MCSGCEAYGLKKHGLTRSDCIAINESWFSSFIYNDRPRYIGTGFLGRSLRSCVQA